MSPSKARQFVSHMSAKTFPPLARGAARWLDEGPRPSSARVIHWTRTRAIAFAVRARHGTPSAPTLGTLRKAEASALGPNR
jgi:hypothetical protein